MLRSRATGNSFRAKRTGQRDVYSLARIPTGKGGQTQSAPPFYQIAALASNGASAIFFDRSIAMLLEETA